MLPIYVFALLGLGSYRFAQSVGVLIVHSAVFVDVALSPCTYCWAQTTRVALVQEERSHELEQRDALRYEKEVKRKSEKKARCSSLL